MIAPIGQAWTLIKQLWIHNTVRQIAIVIITAIVTSLITHTFDSRKLRKQQQIAFQDSLGKKIVESYLKTREIVLQLETIEALPESIQFSRNNKEKVEDLLYYPAIMTDIQTLSEYCIKVSDTRHLHEPYLSNKAAAFLLILERYLMEVANFIGNSKLQADTKRVGFLVHPDLQKIERALDDVIIHGINKPKYHLESKRTRRYRYLKATLKKKYIDKSILMGIIDDSNIQNAPNFSSKNDGNKS